MARFILVHGAWHGGWCWWRIVDRLTALGHDVEAPDLPSHGSDPTPPAGVTLGDYAARIGAILDEHREPCILVGHSLGGLTVGQVSEQHPDKLEAAVYVAALVPVPGEELLPSVTSESFKDRLSLSADRTVITFLKQGAREVFYGMCSDEDIAYAIARLCPQSASVMSNTPVLTAARFGRVPRIYIECLEDRALPIAGQREMHERADFRSVYPIDSDHSPFFSKPDELAAILHRIAT